MAERTRTGAARRPQPLADCEITYDLSRIDFRATSDLIKASYWGAERTDLINARAFAHSFCAMAFVDRRQVGFGRAVTDGSVFGYLADVVVWPGQRGKGIGSRIVRSLIDHPELREVSHWCLRTSDAHELYERFGFKPSTDGSFMRLTRKSGHRHQ